MAEDVYKRQEYVLNKTIEELQEDGSIVLTGTEVKTAKAAIIENDLKNKENVVDLTLTEEGRCV